MAKVITAMVTPFDSEGALNLDFIPDYLAFQRENGIDGVVPSGTNGEATSMSVEERKALLEYVLGHRTGLTIIAGTGAASVTDAVELTKHASQVGADACLVLPPFYYKNPSARGVADYFLQVLDASTIPTYLYNIPHQSAVPITDDILVLLRGHPRLAGIKDSAGNWDRTHALITGYPELNIFSGADELLSRSIAAGSAGGISGSANAFPELVSGVKNAATPEDAAAIQAKLDTAKRILMQYPLIAVNKSVIAHRGVGRMHVRPPLIDLTEPQESELIARLKGEALL